MKTRCQSVYCISRKFCLLHPENNVTEKMKAEGVCVEHCTTKKPDEVWKPVPHAEAMKYVPSAAEMTADSHWE